MNVIAWKLVLIDSSSAATTLSPQMYSVLHYRRHRPQGDRRANDSKKRKTQMYVWLVTYIICDILMASVWTPIQVISRLHNNHRLFLKRISRCQLIIDWYGYEINKFNSEKEILETFLRRIFDENPRRRFLSGVDYGSRMTLIVQRRWMRTISLLMYGFGEMTKMNSWERWLIYVHSCLK